MSDEFQIAVLQERLDAVYAERQKLIVALARAARVLGCRVGVRPMMPAERGWHDGIVIDLPTGQVTWHFADADAEMLTEFPRYKGEWDGHDTTEKYRRLLAWEPYR